MLMEFSHLRKYFFFGYLKKTIASSRCISQQEKHSTIYDKKCNDEFKGKLFFSQGQSNSYRVAIGFIGNVSSEVSNNKKKHDSSRILILDAKVSDNDFLVIDLNNANNESEQLNTL